MLRVGGYRQRCEELLTAEESILLDAEAACWRGLFRQFGSGRAYLTNRRIIWISFYSRLLMPLHFWVPEVVSIGLSSIDSIRLVRWLARAWLRIETAGKTYQIRPGKGPHPFLRDNPRTTEKWLHAIEALRSGHAVVAEALPAERPGAAKLAGKLLIPYSISTTPLCMAGLVMVEAPLVLFVLMGVIGVVGVAFGLLLIRKA